MLKPKSKQELIQALSKADILDLVIEVIKRTESTSAKRSKGKSFTKNVEEAVSDQRDVILACIKLR